MPILEIPQPTLGYNATDPLSPPLLPCQACADKLRCEMADFGYPPMFPAEDPEKKARGETTTYQWNIMKSLGLVDEEIKK